MFVEVWLNFGVGQPKTDFFWTRVGPKDETSAISDVSCSVGHVFIPKLLKHQRLANGARVSYSNLTLS